MSELLEKAATETSLESQNTKEGQKYEGSEVTSSLPPLEKKVTIEKDGITTEILCTSFSNRIVIFISQINKIGTLINAWSEQKNDGGKIYQTSVLLGKRDDPLLTIYARQLIEKIALNSNKTLLLGISLKEEGRSRDQFQFIINEALSQWQCKHQH